MPEIVFMSIFMPATCIYNLHATSTARSPPWLASNWYGEQMSVAVVIHNNIKITYIST